MSRPLSLAVVGGGASAVCLLDALERTGAGPGELTVFEPAELLWRGRPYQQDVPAVRVNIAPDGMTARFGDHGHFTRWLTAATTAPGPAHPHYDPWCETTLVPRTQYGDYLDATAQAAIDALRSRGWQVRLVPEHVDRAYPDGDHIVLGTPQGHRIRVRYAVLCVGVGKPADSYFLTGAAGFVPDPYPLADRLAGVDADAEIAVLGSGLAGVDVVLALAARGHRGRIRLLSRSGVLPAVRQRVVPYTLRHFTASRFRTAAARGERMNLAGLIELMREELAAAGADPDALACEVAAVGAEDPVRRLRRQLAEVDKPDLGLRILQKAVPTAGPDVWPLLSETFQAEVLREHYRTVMSLCCPMPPSSARRLADLFDAGLLEVVAGLRAVRPLVGGGFRIEADGGQHRVDVIVNAVDAPAHRIPSSAEALTASLVESGITVRHPLGGVRVERATSGLSDGRRVDTRVYALGHLASGSLFFTFGMPSIVDRAYDIAQAVAAHAAQAEAAGMRETLPVR